VLLLHRSVAREMVAHCLDGYPLEACGLVGGRPGDDAEAVLAFPTANAAASAKLYRIEGREMLHVDRAAEAAGLELIGVWHSHTHTDAYPSPTDVAQAPDPSWHYVLVSLRDAEPVVRSYRVREGRVEEEPVVLQ
jgi:[CysO sulfur-carrier protein]-S-L-cysteine hydrolase